MDAGAPISKIGLSMGDYLAAGTQDGTVLLWDKRKL